MASFCLFSFFSNKKLQKNCWLQLDSNLNRWSRRVADHLTTTTTQQVQVYQIVSAKSLERETFTERKTRRRRRRRCCHSRSWGRLHRDAHVQQRRSDLYDDTVFPSERVNFSTIRDSATMCSVKSNTQRSFVINHICWAVMVVVVKWST